jgi:class 3 adenylate cyclase
MAQNPLLRRGGDALRILVDLLPEDLDPRSGDEETCIVFADVEGYSAFVADAGDDGAISVLKVLDQVVENALTGRGTARVVKRLGDGLMLSARQPDDALRVSVSLVRGFDREMRELGWPLRLRAGGHRGRARRQGSDYFGYHVNLAARVTEQADGGSALATDMLLTGVDLDALGLQSWPAGTLEAKGVTDGGKLFRVGETERHSFASTQSASQGDESREGTPSSRESRLACGRDPRRARAR